MATGNNKGKTLLLEFPSNKINVTKMHYFLQASVHHSFNFNLQFLYKLKHMVDLSKTVSRIFQFRFHLVFIKVYISIQQKV